MVFGSLYIKFEYGIYKMLWNNPVSEITLPIQAERSVGSGDIMTR